MKLTCITNSCGMTLFDRNPNDMQTPLNIKFQIVTLLISLSVSILLGFILNWLDISLSTGEQVLTTIMLFIAFVVLDILWVSERANSYAKHENDLWVQRSEGEGEIGNIRYYFGKLVDNAQGKSDLFVSYFERSINNLEREIRNAVEKKEISIDESYFFRIEGAVDTFIGEIIFDIFIHDPNPILKYTWPILKNDPLFDDYQWRRFFEASIKMLAKKRIRGIQVIIICENLKHLEEPSMVKLLGFFKIIPGLGCKIILSNDYQTVCIQNGVLAQYSDFGIYSNKMLFRRKQDKAEYVGTYTKDCKVISTYQRLFDIIWASDVIALTNPSKNTMPISLQELISFDLQRTIKEN